MRVEPLGLRDERLGQGSRSRLPLKIFRICWDRKRFMGSVFRILSGLLWETHVWDFLNHPYRILKGRTQNSSGSPHFSNPMKKDFLGPNFGL